MKNNLFCVFACAVLVVACNSSQKMTQYVKGNFDKQGHRGCRGLMPENTIPAMIKALGYGVTTLEMDICISRDRKVFLSHEPFFNHEFTTLPNGKYIEEGKERSYNMFTMDYDSISKYDVGLKTNPRFPKQEKIKATKPLLSDVFLAVNNAMMTRKRPFPYYNIEAKTLPETDGVFHPAPSEFVELLIAVIKDNHMEKQVIIQSFDFRVLQYIHKHYPTMATAMLIEPADKRSFRKQLTDLGFNPTIYSPGFELVTKSLVDDCHTKNIRIIPWTVNDKTKINGLKELGVDGLISDYPDLLND